MGFFVFPMQLLVKVNSGSLNLNKIKIPLPLCFPFGQETNLKKTSHAQVISLSEGGRKTALGRLLVFSTTDTPFKYCHVN